MNDWDALAYNRPFVITVELIGLAFFGRLALKSLRHPRKRIYLPGLLLINLGFFNSLVRNLFFFHLSPRLGTTGGWWRLGAALLIVLGAIVCLRAWTRQRRA